MQSFSVNCAELIDLKRVENTKKVLIKKIYRKVIKRWYMPVMRVKTLYVPENEDFRSDAVSYKSSRSESCRRNTPLGAIACNPLFSASFMIIKN